MKKKKILIIICALIAVFLIILSLDCGALRSRNAAGSGIMSGLIGTVRSVQNGTADYVILIDPGHGGMDGGASAADGTLEKDINLSIAKLLAKEAERYNCRVILTREHDQWLCDTDEGSIRSRKTADLMARRDMIRKYEPDVTIGIHLNSFKEDPGVRGAQVFYPSQDALQQCRLLAETMQKSLNETLQPENPRTAMTRDGVLIFREVEQPVIIIECGFMSNPEEAEQLKSEGYQQELAMCIMTGIAEFAGLTY